MPDPPQPQSEPQPRPEPQPGERRPTLRVVLITHDAIYQGLVPARTPAGQPVRFIDILRSPSRIMPGNVAAKPGLHLDQAVRRPRRGGEEVRFDGPVVLRPDAVLAAYDRGGSRSAPGTAYEQREAERQRVRLYLHSDLAVEATLVGGRRVLEGIRSETFIACTEVVLTAGTRRQLPFLAVNTNHIESVAGVDVAGVDVGGAD